MYADFCTYIARSGDLLVRHVAERHDGAAAGVALRDVCRFLFGKYPWLALVWGPWLRRAWEWFWVYAARFKVT
jgi:hypothetical protein